MSYGTITTIPRVSTCASAAGWKPAIQQVGNLRYSQGLLATFWPGTRGIVTPSLRHSITPLLRLLVVPAMLLAIAVSLRAQESADNVVIVLDCSGSMNERLAGTQTKKMDAAKEALKAVIQKVPQNTRIGLIVFGLASQREDWAYPLGPRDDARLTAAI